MIPRPTIRLAAILMALATAAAAQQDSFSELCQGQTLCVGDGECKIDTLSFYFDYESDATGADINVVRMPGEDPIIGISEPSTQGYTWSSDTHVYAMLYLFNDAFADSDPAEFVLMVSGMNARMDAATIYAGTCEILD